MEFLLKMDRVMEKIVEVMEFCYTLMEKSWNFVAIISWQAWYGI